MPTASVSVRELHPHTFGSSVALIFMGNSCSHNYSIKFTSPFFQNRPYILYTIQKNLITTYNASRCNAQNTRALNLITSFFFGKENTSLCTGSIPTETIQEPQ